MKSTLLKLLVALFTLSLIAAACGSDDDTADSGDSDALAEAEAALAAAEEARWVHLYILLAFQSPTRGHSPKRIPGSHPSEDSCRLPVLSTFHQS